MKHRLALITILLWLTASGPADACIEPEVPTFRQSLDSATVVFVARLNSVGLVNKSQASRDIAGQLEIIRTLKGNPSFHYLRHEAIWCGGLRLLVGHYYLFATDQSGSVLRLVRGDRSIVDVSEDYSMQYPPKKPEQLWQTKINDYLNGRPLPKNFQIWNISHPVQAFPPQPGEEW
jgi:hypothetical protein